MGSPPATSPATGMLHQRLVAAAAHPGPAAWMRVQPGPSTWPPAAPRMARPDDLPAIRALHADAWRRLARADYTAAQIESFIRQGTMDTSLVTSGRYYVLEQQGTLLACAGWQRDEGVDLPVPTALVRAVYVHPDRARCGLGRLMMKHVHSMARQAGCRTLRLTATLTGVPLYRKLGYAETARVHWPLPGGLSLAARDMALRGQLCTAERCGPTGGARLRP